MPWVPTNEIVQTQIDQFTAKGDSAFAAAMTALQSIAAGFNSSPAAQGVSDGISLPAAPTPASREVPLPPLATIAFPQRERPGTQGLPILPDAVRPVPPEPPNIEMAALDALPPPPDAGEIGTAIREAFSKVPSSPEFTATEPILQFPSPPNAILPTRPHDPEPFRAPAYPDAPPLESNEAPALFKVVLPELARPNLTPIRARLQDLQHQTPTLGALPVAPNLAERMTHYLSLHGGIVADTLQGLVPALESLLAPGSLGIDAATAALMRSRAFAAEDQQAEQARQQALTDWVSRGFTLPGGALQGALKEIQQTSRDKKAQLNREIWIEETKQRLESLRLGVQQGIAYEAMHKDALGKMLTICAQLAGQEVDAWAKLVEGTLSTFNAKVSIWQAQFAAVRDEIQAELALMEVYKSELEGQKLIGQINQQATDLYRAKEEALGRKIERYKAQIDAANGLLQGELGKLDAASKAIQLYTAEIGAYETQWKTYGTAIQAEASKTEVYKAVAQAYSARMDGYGRSVDAAKSQASLQVESLNSLIKLWETHVAKRSADIQAETARVDALLRGYESQVRGFASQVQSEETFSNIGAKKLDAALGLREYQLKELAFGLQESELDLKGGELGIRVREQELQNRELQIKAGEYHLKQLELDLNKFRVQAEIKFRDADLKQTHALETSKIAISAMDGVARTAAQLSGSAMSAMHVAATIGSDSRSSNDYAENHNYNYQM